MKKFLYLPILSVFFLLGCSSEDDSVTPEPTPEPPIDNSFYTLPETLEDYYEGVDFSLEEEELKEELAVHTIEKHSNFLNYGERHNYLYDADADPTNPANVILIYTGDSRDAREYESGNNTHEPQTFNTEHIYPKSLLGGEAVNDLHILRVADRDVNSQRSNYPYTDGEGSYELKGSAFFPGEEWRGDVARMVMYMNLRYDEPFSDVGNLDLFLEWNAEDPISYLEIQRNNVIEDAQGNRNPFIDNPHLATRIWGGEEEADNRWDGDSENNDTEAPSVPQGLTVSEADFETVTITWEASTDNDRVSRYTIYVDGESFAGTTSTSTTLSGLTPGTTYSIAVSAEDPSGNASDQTDEIEATTTADEEAPSVPQNVEVTGTTAATVSLSWTTSTDNAGIEGYDIFIDGEFYRTVTETEYTVAGLEAETTYSFAIAARDIYENVSEVSETVQATTAEASETGEGTAAIILSEYIEGSFGNNKALEIANVSDEAVDLSAYSLMKDTNGERGWDNEYTFSGTLEAGEVFVIVNANADFDGIFDAADDETTHQIVSFNGNDPIGLFKDGELIDIIGVMGGDDFATDVNLRRKTDITTPNTTFTIDEWEVYDDEDTSGLGTR